jgi:hypothetical protein
MGSTESFLGGIQLKLSLGVALTLMLSTHASLACGNDFNTAYLMWRNHEIQAKPVAFEQQVTAALNQCDYRIQVRNETHESNELDAAFVADRKNCEEMAEAMTDGNENKLATAFCLYAAIRTYGWSLMAEDR